MRSRREGSSAELSDTRRSGSADARRSSRETGDAREQLCDSDVSGDALIHLDWVWAEAKEMRQIHLAYDMSGMAQSAGRALPGERHYQED